MIHLDYKRKIKSLKALIRIIPRLKKAGKRIVFTNGCFDILHTGHISYLQTAKGKGDVLIVAINSDRSVKNIKGNARPVISEKDRTAVVAALESVDFVTIFDEPTPLKTIETLRPNVLVKGGDWQKQDIIGSDFVELYGGKVIRVPYIKGHSTSGLIKKIVWMTSYYTE